ncbi:exocyst complex component exo70 [Malassezia sp. CBS 17886]|nr:exocyst complex component exo70 [Malassezia sp. CBS 17886]
MSSQLVIGARMRGRSVSSAKAPAEDYGAALTELELLEPNQKRLASLTGRMTTILNGFDRRLVRLESSILPIHQSTRKLSKISANVDATQEELGRSLHHFGVVVDDEPSILRGPDLRDPWAYLESTQRIVKGIESATSGAMSNPEQLLSKLHNIADLVREYTSTESRPVNPHTYQSDTTPLPALSPDCTTSIKALLQFLSTLPRTSAAPGEALASALATYSTVRAKFLVGSIEPLLQQVCDVASRAQDPSIHAPREVYVEYHRGMAGFQDWLRMMVRMMRNERAIAESIFDGMQWQPHLDATYTDIVKPMCESVNTLLPTLLPTLQHGLNAHRMLSLDFIASYAAALGADGRGWTGVVPAPLAADLVSAASTVHTNTLQFFPEFIRDVKVIPVQREHDALHVNVSDIARLGVQLLRGVTEFQDVVHVLMRSLGHRNWASVGPAEGAAAPSADSLFTDYMKDLLTAIVTSLERSVAAVPQPTIAAIFLLTSNITYLQRELAALQPTLDPSTASASERVLSQALRSARTSYLESWNSVVSTLVDDGGNSPHPGRLSAFGHNDGAAAHDPFARFYDALQEKERIHRKHPLDRTNPALSKCIREDVSRLVCPLYAVFLAKQRGTATGTRRPTEQELDAIIGQFFL